MTVEKVMWPPFYDITDIAITVKEMPQTLGFVPVGEMKYLPDPILHTMLPVNLNIQQDQPLEFKFDWNQGGALITNWATLPPAMQAAIPTVVHYEIELFFEKMGTGDDRNFSIVVPFNPTATCTQTITLPVDAVNQLAEGVYKVVSIFKLDFHFVFQGKFVAGFKEIGFVNVFKQEW